MSPADFQRRLLRLKQELPDFFNRYVPTIIGRTAVSFFKRTFQKEAWDRQHWPEVKRRTPGTPEFRQAARHHPARKRRKILTGDTGDLARSIEVEHADPHQVTIFTNPAAFKSRAPYGRVHNEGLRAGRGSGFIMPKRQFMGHSRQLDRLISHAIETKLKKILNK